MESDHDKETIREIFQEWRECEALSDSYSCQALNLERRLLRMGIYVDDPPDWVTDTEE